MKRGQRHQIPTTLPDDLRATIEGIAKDDARSVSYVVGRLVEDALDGRARSGDRVVIKPLPREPSVRGVRRRRTMVLFPQAVFTRLEDFAWSQRRSLSEAIAMLVHESLTLRAARKSA